MVQDLVKECGKDADLVPAILDLDDLDSVRAFVKHFSSLNLPLHLLINNAGIMALPQREENAQGIEKQMGTNHVSHFVLTMGLLDNLREGAKSAGEARVVCLSSMAHGRADNAFATDAKLESKTYDPWVRERCFPSFPLSSLHS